MDKSAKPTVFVQPSVIHSMNQLFISYSSVKSTAKKTTEYRFIKKFVQTTVKSLTTDPNEILIERRHCILADFPSYPVGKFQNTA